MFLLNINILIALSDYQHQDYDRAARFFETAKSSGWATCPLTENGFLRIFGHPNYPGGPTSPQDARYFLHSFSAEPGHQFWPDSISLLHAKGFPTLPASKHITDFYLLALAIHRKARLATLDSRIDPSLLPHGPPAYFVIP